jgi:hypothetical protein
MVQEMDKNRTVLGHLWTSLRLRDMPATHHSTTHAFVSGRMIQGLVRGCTHPAATAAALPLVCVTCTGKYVVVMDSDAWHFGGKGRVAWDSEHFTTPATEEEGGKFNDRDQYFQVGGKGRGVSAFGQTLVKVRVKPGQNKTVTEGCPNNLGMQFSWFVSWHVEYKDMQRMQAGDRLKSITSISTCK